VPTRSRNVDRERHQSFELGIGEREYASAAKQATQDIPIVLIGGDPVQGGIVASLARPGGNITGISLMSAASNAKTVELFRDMLPSVLPGRAV